MQDQDKPNPGRVSDDAPPHGLSTGADLGHAIRRLRRTRRWTIEELAFASGVHPSYVSGIERGSRNPSWEKACALAHGLGVPIAYLSARAESAARIREGTENVLEQERARLADSGRPPGWAQEDAA
ncbi:MAG TPA: helix-turn-helix transcriptional regulator [Solirubrobacteraceae bacterium]|jgi:transcriptional regulator with XRE-family HTH domain|nr:helix-turn-helix transcriptional regulator [Solirubrobacteraceae bacterium]